MIDNINANINFGDAFWGSYEYCLLSSDLDKSKYKVTNIRLGHVASFQLLHHPLRHVTPIQMVQYHSIPFSPLYLHCRSKLSLPGIFKRV